MIVNSANPDRTDWIEDIMNLRWLYGMELTTRLLVCEFQLNNRGLLELRALDKFCIAPMLAPGETCAAAEYGIIDILYCITLLGTMQYREVQYIAVTHNII